MAKSPQPTDYVRLIIELSDRFRQEHSARAGAKPGRPFRYSEESFQIAMIVNAKRGLPHGHISDIATAFQRHLRTPLTIKCDFVI